MISNIFMQCSAAQRKSKNKNPFNSLTGMEKIQLIEELNVTNNLQGFHQIFQSVKNTQIGLGDKRK